MWGPWDSVLGLAVLPPDGKAVNCSRENRGSLPWGTGVFKTTDEWKPGLQTKTTNTGPPPLNKETDFPPHPLLPGRVERPDLGQKEKKPETGVSGSCLQGGVEQNDSWGVGAFLGHG